MPSSSRVIKAEESADCVFTFKPYEIKDRGRKEPVYVDSEESGFQLNPLVSQQLGLADAQAREIEERVNKEAIERLAEIQEKGYKEAYALGMEDGRTDAFRDTREELKGCIARLNSLVQEILNLRSEMVKNSESEIVELVYYLSKRLLMRELELDPELILEVISRTVDLAQTDEQITVQLSHDDFNLLNEIRDKLQAEIDKPERLHLVSSPLIQSGGCIVETNYGSIDATIEQRLQRCWENLKDKMPLKK